MADSSAAISTATPVPFWQRIPKFFRFPFYGSVAWVLLALAAASMAIPLLPVPAPVDLLLGEVLIWLTALRHAFGIMEKTSRGFLSPAQYPIAEQADPARVNLPWKLLAIFIIWGMIAGFVQAISSFLGILVRIFMTVAMPATVMTLSMTNSVGETVNPLRWVAVMRGVGKPYIALFVFLAVLSSGGGYVLPIVAPVVPKTLAIPVFNLVFLYFNLVMFVMMGYALYQYHGELDLHIEVQPEDQAEAAKPRAAPADPVADMIAAMVTDGNVGGALDVAYEDQRRNPESIVAQERFHQLLLLAGRRDRALDHGRRYLTLLVRTNRLDLGIALLKRLRELDPAFQPERTEDILPLARTAAKSRDPALAFSLINGFDKRFPGHRDIPAVYLFSAQVLCDSYRKDDLARAILTGMLKKYPDHPLAAEAGGLLKALETLAAKAAPAGAGAAG
jgi:hypothetical protein